VVGGSSITPAISFPQGSSPSQLRDRQGILAIDCQTSSQNKKIGLADSGNHARSNPQCGSNFNPQPWQYFAVTGFWGF